uniref:OmpA-OmpF porin, OOP family n=1 Tax=Candidatus Kentrum sp. MB TaxID=2138164 RepID=A0A450X7M6_9GAMM|nr:MAG: OmpA-OmpF porin, OOP family [Candidatus Kentron sp. MB]VFK33468.1 MAG: OmpA-OmpF porin, OOP family [Candidatus Kentron sp. MB]VFK76227.1 MAG: OmpA-OmpF porin, OOP family [Candidatus Kentron sp. MB]
MRNLRNILLVLLVSLTVSGCATIGKINKCTIIGGIAGGAGGAILAEKAILGVPAAIGGAVLGHLLCREGEGDADGDKILDSKDKCPDTPPRTLVDQDGCGDFDKDGISNYGDQCPNTLPGIKVDNTGCAICGEKLANLQSDVYFATAKCDVAGFESTLETVANALKNTNTKIHIQGHTDSVGQDEYNIMLSQCRADTVKDFLMTRGIDGGNMTSEGRGEGFPIASNETKDGRARNRRVEISVTCNK